jgi:hypothetical protein
MDSYPGELKHDQTAKQDRDSIVYALHVDVFRYDPDRIEAYKAYS